MHPSKLIPAHRLRAALEATVAAKPGAKRARKPKPGAPRKALVDRIRDDEA